MKGYYNIKNFRCFDSNGVDIHFEPITLLTGSNSSGKSSIVKSLLLLTDYLSSALEMRRYSYGYYSDFESILTRTRLDFSKYPNNLLGNFEKVIHRGIESKTISYTYAQYSKALKDDLFVELSFSLLDSDDMKDGWLSSLQISDSSNNVICKAHNEAGLFVYDFVNLFALKPFFMLHNAMNTIAFSERFKDSSDLKINNEQIAFLKNYLKENNIDAENIQPFADGVGGFSYPYYRDSLSVSFIKYDVIFYHHFLEVLDSKSKEETIAFLADKALKTKEDDIIRMMNSICSDFNQSEYLNFIDYYRAKENNALVTSGRKEAPKSFRHRESVFRIYTNVPIHIPGNKRDLLGADSFEIQQGSPISIGDILGCFIAVSKHNDSDNYMIRRWGPGGLFESFVDFADSIIRASVFADFAKDFNYASSTRADVRRLYALENKDDFSLLLRRYFDAKRKFYSSGLNKEGYVPGDFLNKWIKNFGIGKAIQFDANRDGLGVALNVIKENGSKNILAEEGYGITQLFSILLQIEVSVIETIIANHSEDNHPYVTIAIEEPEIHLHPMYQSLLADVFLDAFTSHGIHFIIETHSEYLIRHTQYLVAKAQYSSQDTLDNECPFKVYYFPAKSPAYDMRFRTNGKFVESFGEGFLDESDKWVMKMYEQDW